MCPRAAKVPRQVEDPVVVDAALHDRVDLHGQPGLGGRVDSFEDARDREVDVVHRAEGLVVERVEAHGDARQARVGQRLRLPRQERPVRRQRQVDAERREHLDQPLDVAAHERLAAGDAELAHAVRDEGAREALDLLVVEQLRAREELVVAPEDLLRHAVRAAEVAPIGDRDAEVAQRPAESVHSRSVPGGIRLPARRASSQRRSMRTDRVDNAGAESRSTGRRARARHGRVGRHLRPDQGRARALSALRVPRGALRDRRRGARRSRPRRGCARSARDGVVAGGALGALLAAGYALQTAGLERTTVSAAGFVTGMYVVLTPVFGFVLFRLRRRSVGLGRRRARGRRARAC